MPGLLQKNLSVRLAALIVIYWIVVFIIPFVIVDADAKPGALGWSIFAALIGYFGYSGWKAFRRGAKTAFILRIVVPAGLLVTAASIVAALRWL